MNTLSVSRTSHRSWLVLTILFYLLRIVPLWYAAAALTQAEVEVLAQAQMGIYGLHHFPLRWCLHPPLQALFYTVWMYFGGSELWVRFPVLISMVGFCVPLYLLLVRFVRPPVGFLVSAWILSFSVTQWAFVGLINYAFPAALCALLLYWTSIWGGRSFCARQAIAFFSASVIAFLSHYGTAFVSVPGFLVLAYELFRSGNMPGISDTNQTVSYSDRNFRPRVLSLRNSFNPWTRYCLVFLLFTGAFAFWHFQRMDTAIAEYLYENILSRTERPLLAIFLEGIPQVSFETQWLNPDSFLILVISVASIFFRPAASMRQPRQPMLAIIIAAPLLLQFVASLFGVYPWVSGRHQFFLLPSIALYLAVCLDRILMIFPSIADSVLSCIPEKKLSLVRAVAAVVFVLSLVLTGVGSIRLDPERVYEFSAIEAINAETDRLFKQNSGTTVYLSYKSTCLYNWYGNRRPHGSGFFPTEVNADPGRNGGSLRWAFNMSTADDPERLCTDLPSTAAILQTLSRSGKKTFYLYRRKSVAAVGTQHFCSFFDQMNHVRWSVTASSRIVEVSAELEQASSPVQEPVKQVD